MHNIKLTLLVSSFILPFALSLTMLAQSDKSIAKRVMVVALFNSGIAFLFNYFYFEKFYTLYASIHSLHIASVLWLFPSVYLYIKALTVNENDFRKELRHIYPGMAFGLISALLFYGLLNTNERLFYLISYRSGIHFTSPGLEAVYIFRAIDVTLIVLQIIYYSIMLIKLPQSYREKLLDEFSNIDGFSLDWIKGFDIAFVVVGILSIIFYILNPFKEENEFFLISFLFLISLFIWIIGILSMRQQKITVMLTEQDSNSFLIDEPVITNDDPLIARLMEQIETNEIFLQPDLSLTTLSKEIGTNRTYLSNLINQQFGLNFNAFINQYRVIYVLEYRKTHPQASNEDLMHAGGFGSVISMKRAIAKWGEQNKEE